jgi:uncharacterized membrane protein
MKDIIKFMERLAIIFFILMVPGSIILLIAWKLPVILVILVLLLGIISGNAQ